MSVAVVTVEHVAKTFGKPPKAVEALKGVSFEIQQGEVFGLLGPNGAGKTTLLKILATLATADAGRATVAGIDVADDAPGVRGHIGLVFQEPSLDAILTGRENLRLHARLYGLDRDTANERIEAMLELAELTARGDHLVKTYSGGMKRRLEIARGILHEPDVLFLDEPTLGLDPASRERLWDHIRRLRDEGTTVLLTTHYMEEADSLCDRIAIIDHGEIAALGTPVALKDELGQTVVRLRQTNGSADAFDALDFVSEVEQHEGDVVLHLSGGVGRLHEIVGAAGPIESLEVRTPTLQDVFLHHTGRDLRDAEEGGEGWAEEVARLAYTSGGDDR